MTYVAALRVRNKCPAELNVAKDILRISKSTQSIFSGFLFWGCHGQVGVQGFQVGMSAADK